MCVCEWASVWRRPFARQWLASAASGRHMSSPPTGWPTSPEAPRPPPSLATVAHQAHHISHTTFAALNLTQKARALAASKKGKDAREERGEGDALGKVAAPPHPTRMSEYKRAATTRTTTAVPGSLSSDPQPSKVVVWHPLQSRHSSPPTPSHSLITAHKNHPNQPAPGFALPSASKQAWPATQPTDFDAQSTRCSAYASQIYTLRKL